MFNKLPFQIIVLVLIGLFVGLINNTISPNRIPWFQDYDINVTVEDTVWKPFSWDPSYDHVFKLLSARKAYDSYLHDKGIFVDARTDWEYDEGHIVGAINIDFETEDDGLFESQLAYLAEIADTNSLIITYCAGTECDASLMLARYLYYDLGYSNVSIFFGGWDFWTEEGLPIEDNLE